MANIFTHVKGMRPGRSSFPLGHDRKLSCNFGYLYPVLFQDCLPGDMFRNSTTAVFRFSPLVSPVMHRYKARFYSFFVPYRLVWDEYAEFFGSSEDGMTVPIMPGITVSNDSPFRGLFSDKTLSDYLGIAPPVGTDFQPYRINVLGHRSYQLVWNEYFRDQNLDEAIPILKTSGEQLPSTDLLSLRRIRWHKDYFTSALPFAQRGPTVNLPLAGDAPIRYSNPGNEAQLLVSPNGGSFNEPTNLQGRPAGSTDPHNVLTDENGASTNKYWNIDPNGTLIADLSQAGATTWNDLRTAARLQTWFENSARGGSRYTEQIKAHFGQHTGDARLDRPEYLGGGTQDIVISEVLQTSETEGTPQGNMAGHGVSGGRPNSFFKRVPEHGCIITVMSVMPEVEYMQVTPRFFLKQDKYDFAYPEFAHLGEQPVWNGEIGFYNRDPLATFGYQSRYSDYKFAHSQVHGEFRNTLSFWNHARQFTSAPNLNPTFVAGNPDYRVFAVTDSSFDHIYVWLRHDLMAKRPLPKFGTPTPI